MPKQERAATEVMELVRGLIHQYHPHLESVRLTLDLMMVHPDLDNAGQPVGPALKLHGVPALAIAKITPYAGRAKGLCDVEIQIAADHWADMGHDERAALLDHELSHFGVCRDEAEVPKRDDLGRPKLRTILHDHQFGWFDHIAARWGKASPEQQSARKLFEESGQLYWPDVIDTRTGVGGMGRFRQLPNGTQIMKEFADSLPKGTSLEISSGSKSVTLEGKR